MLAAYPGPVITRYEIEPAVGVKGAQIVNLMKDLARALSVVSIRVVETIPGKSCMGLELPNPQRQVVQAGRDPRVDDVQRRAGRADAGARQGHRRQAGGRRSRAHAAPAGRRHDGSGKSVAVNAMILSLLYKAEPQAGAPDPDRSEDARAVGVRRHPASAGAGRHRHEARAQRAQLVRRRDGAPLQADVAARRAQPRRLQPEGRRGEEGRQAAAQSARADARQRRSRSRRCR